MSVYKTMAYRAVAEASASTYTVDCDKPTGTTDGDILFAIVSTNNAVNTPTAPVGWTSVAASVSRGIFWKRASSEGASYTFTTGSTATPVNIKVAVVAYQYGAASGDVVHAYSDTAYVTSNTTLRAAQVDPSQQPTMLLFAGYPGGGSTSAPTNFTERLDSNLYLADREYASTDATGNVDATLGSATTVKHAYLVSVIPDVYALPGTPTISAPTASGAAEGATVSLTASASQADGLQVKYRWKYDAGAGDQDIGDTSLVDSGVADTYSWDTTGLALGAYTLKCWAVDAEDQVSTTYDSVAFQIADVVITAPADGSSHVSGTVTLTGKGYLTAAGSLQLQWEIDTADPPSDANDDYDLITSALVAQDTAVSVVGNVDHLGTWYVRARTLDTSDATSSWTSTITIYVLEALRLDAGSQVELSIAGTVNKVYVLAAKSSPAVTGSATNTTIAPTYANSPRETLVLAPEGADSTACAAIASAQLAIRQSERVNISGLKVKLEDGMKLDRGDLVGVSIERMGIDGTYPIREMQFDVANDSCEITVGEFWEPRTDEDALIAIAQKVQSLQKEAAQ